MNLLSRLSFVMKEGFHNFIKARGLSVAVVIVVGATLLQLSVFLGLSKVLDNVLGSAREKLEMVLFLSPTAGDADLQRLQVSLVADPRVSSVKVVTKDDALQEFRQDPEIDRMVQALGENPLTDSLSVFLRPEAAADQLEQLADQLRKDPAIEEVDYGKNEWQTMAGLTQAARWLGLFLGGFIFLTSLFIVSNTLTLGLWARKEDMILLERMGAPTWMQWGPYLFEGIIQGVLGGLGVVLALELTRHGLAAFLPKFGGFDALFKLPPSDWWSLYWTLLLLGIILGGAGALWALQKKWVKDLEG